MARLLIGALVIAVLGVAIWREMMPTGMADPEDITTLHPDTLAGEWISKTLYDGDARVRIEQALALGTAADLGQFPYDLPENPQDLVIGDVIAATELLAALLGKPTASFERHLESRSRFLRRVFSYRKQRINPTAYRPLVPQALALAQIFQQPAFIQEYGFYNEDTASFAASVQELEARLRELAAQD